MTESREKVEEVANRIRRELLATLAELDRRRDRALDPKYQLQRHLPVVLAIAAGGTLALGLGSGWAIYRRRTRPRRLVRQRIRSLQRAWQHPERLASRAKDLPSGLQLVRRLMLAFGLALGSQVAKRAALRMVPAPEARRPALVS